MNAGWSIDTSGTPQELRAALDHVFVLAEKHASRLPIERRSIARVKRDFCERLDWLIEHKITTIYSLRASATTHAQMDGFPGGSTLWFRIERGARK